MEEELILARGTVGQYFTDDFFSHIDSPVSIQPQFNQSQSELSHDYTEPLTDEVDDFLEGDEFLDVNMEDEPCSNVFDACRHFAQHLGQNYGVGVKIILVRDDSSICENQMV